MTTDNPVNGFPPPPPKGDEEAPELVQVGTLPWFWFLVLFYYFYSVFTGSSCFCCCCVPVLRIGTQI